jgi:hypothetical protein
MVWPLSPGAEPSSSSYHAGVSARFSSLCRVRDRIGAGLFALCSPSLVVTEYFAIESITYLHPFLVTGEA